MNEVDIPPPPSKRLRDNEGNASAVVSMVQYRQQQQPPEAETIRTSSLPAPTMQLSGHKGSIYALEYCPSGETLASGGFDMKVFLWSHSDGYTNFNVLEGHKNAVLDLKWLDESHLVTASADKTLVYWDTNTGDRLRSFKGHSMIVNAVDTATTTSAGTTADSSSSSSISNPHLFVSASDDATAKIWDARQKRETSTLEHDFQVTAVALDGTNQIVYTGGIDNTITAWDVRQSKRTMGLKGHTDTITSLSLHPKSTHLLSNSMDNTIRTWDIRPFCAEPQRQCKTFEGAKHNAEKRLLRAAWSPDGSMISCGSADRMVRVFDEYSTEELYLLPGHKGCVNTVIFHPKENVIARYVRFVFRLGVLFFWLAYICCCTLCPYRRAFFFTGNKT